MQSLPPHDPPRLSRLRRVDDYELTAAEFYALAWRQLRIGAAVFGSVYSFGWLLKHLG